MISAMVRLRSTRFLQVLIVSAFFALYAFFLFYDHRSNDSPSSSSSASASAANLISNSKHDRDIKPAILPHVFISIKTTEKFHATRVRQILKTWFSSAPEQTFFFTDGDDESLSRQTNGHLIRTNCSSSHNRQALCCKMSVELETFLKRQLFHWFCHFDDDNYVNVPKLLDLLQSYSPQDDWYLGKPSIRAPLQILDRKTGAKIGFWFATGGAGFCLSRSLVTKMTPYVRSVCCSA